MAESPCFILAPEARFSLCLRKGVFPVTGTRYLVQLYLLLLYTTLVQQRPNFLLLRKRYREFLAGLFL